MNLEKSASSGSSPIKRKASIVLDERGAGTCARLFGIAFGSGDRLLRRAPAELLQLALLQT